MRCRASSVTAAAAPGFVARASAPAPIRRRPRPTGDERGQQQDGERSGRRQPIRPEPHAPPRDFLLRQTVTNALPDLEAILIAAFRRVGCCDEPECPRQLAICGGAGLAPVEMDLDVGAAPALVVVVEDQVLFGVVLHDSPRNGSSAVRSFRTARKTLCFVALAPSPSVLPISAIDRPS